MINFIKKMPDNQEIKDYYTFNLGRMKAICLLSDL